MVALKAVPDVDEAGGGAVSRIGQSVSAAASSGDRRALLVSLRERISQDIDEGVPARDLASLSLRLLAIAKEIDDIDTESEGDEIDEAADSPDEKFDPSSI